jgi:predicted phosphoribosyltransferase
VFADRRQAGQQLAAALAGRDLGDPVVFGLARGGVPVAHQVAHGLGGRLEVAVARKIGAPGQPELGLGAITSDGPAVYREDTLRALNLTPEDLAETCEAERREARRRLWLYRGDAPAPAVAGRDVVLVDDGLATGVTARVMLRALRELGPRSLRLAVPVCAAEAAEELAQEVDEVVCVHRPSHLRAVAFWYGDFHPVSDDEVLLALAESPTTGK